LGVVFGKAEGPEPSQLFEENVVIDLHILFEIGADKPDVLLFVNLLFKHLWDLRISSGVAPRPKHLTILEDASYFIPQVDGEQAKTSYIEDVALLQRGTGEILDTVTTLPNISRNVVGNAGIIVSFGTHTERARIEEFLGLPGHLRNLLNLLEPGTCIARVNSIPEPFLLKIPFPKGRERAFPPKKTKSSRRSLTPTNNETSVQNHSFLQNLNSTRLRSLFHSLRPQKTVKVLRIPRKMVQSSPNLSQKSSPNSKTQIALNILNSETHDPSREFSMGEVNPTLTCDQDILGENGRFDAEQFSEEFSAENSHQGNSSVIGGPLISPNEFAEISNHFGEITTLYRTGQNRFTIQKMWKHLFIILERICLQWHLNCESKPEKFLEFINNHPGGIFSPLIAPIKLICNMQVKVAAGSVLLTDDVDRAFRAFRLIVRIVRGNSQIRNTEFSKNPYPIGFGLFSSWDNHFVVPVVSYYSQALSPALLSILDGLILDDDSFSFFSLESIQLVTKPLLVQPRNGKSPSTYGLLLFYLDTEFALDSSRVSFLKGIFSDITNDLIQDHNQMQIKKIIKKYWDIILEHFINAFPSLENTKIQLESTF
jgi:hypothetical protein